MNRRGLIWLHLTVGVVRLTLPVRNSREDVTLVEYHPLSASLVMLYDPGSNAGTQALALFDERRYFAEVEAGGTKDCVQRTQDSSKRSSNLAGARLRQMGVAPLTAATIQATAQPGSIRLLLMPANTVLGSSKFG